jgi:hypothetical protein
MNGRIYDPELGRMLSPDPFVQVPENSQNFNRYSYVLNNPVNLTDPSGFSWVSKVFDKIGNWFSENWRTVVAIAVVVGLAFVLTPIAGVGWNALGQISINSGWAQGAIVGAAAGASNTAINGGNASDILRAAVVGGIQGGITGGLLNGWESTGWNWETLRHVVGHGVVGGSANVALGGKFQDGFLSAAASAAAADFGMLGDAKATGPGALASRTIRAGIVGGTASALGGGKFANGAWTASFQHLLNAELEQFGRKSFVVDHRNFARIGPNGEITRFASLDEFLDWMIGKYVSNPNANHTGQCLSGGQYLCGNFNENGEFVDVYSGSTLAKGEPVSSGPVKGTLVGSGFKPNGLYLNEPSGNHVGIFHSLNNDGTFNLQSQNNSGDQSFRLLPFSTSGWHVLTPTQRSFDAGQSKSVISSSRSYPNHALPSFINKN